MTRNELLARLQACGAHSEATQEDSLTAVLAATLLVLRDERLIQTTPCEDLTVLFSLVADVLQNTSVDAGVFSIDAVHELLEWQAAGFPSRTNSALRKEVEEELAREEGACPSDH